MKQSIFGKNFAAMRNDAGFTQQATSEKLGVTQNTVSGWETRGKAPRQRQTIEAICALFSCTEQDLFGFSDGYYAKQSGLSGSIAAQGANYTANAPIVGSIAAGDPSAAIEMTGETRDLPAKVRERFPGGFFLLVKGDSMNKVLPEGCYAYIAPSDELEIKSGDVAAVKVNGDEATVKRVKLLDGLVILEPESTNPAHRRRVIDESDPDAPYVRILGRVVWYDYEFIKF